MAKKIISVHDRFFRSAMQNTPVAIEFFQHYLPAPLCDGLNLDTINLQPSTFIDKDLRETISDLIFDCHYKNRDNNDQEAKIVLLVEHQSTADSLMPFRVYHYMFSMLNRELKKRKQARGKLPAVYAYCW